MSSAERERVRVYLDRERSALLHRVRRIPQFKARAAAARRLYTHCVCLELDNGLTLNEAISEVSRIFDEKNLKRFILSLAERIKAKKFRSGKFFNSVVDRRILQLWDGFDIFQPKSLHGGNLEMIRSLPGLSRWTAPAASAFLKWDCRDFNEGVQPKTYLMKLHRWGFKMEKPFVRAVRIHEDQGGFTVIFSRAGIQWLREKFYKKQSKKYRTTN
jgi:hypothetical protein